MKIFGIGVGRIFVTGLLTLLPAVVTVYFLVWLVRFAEGLFGKPLQRYLPESYHAGMGILAAVALVFVVGALMHAYVFRRIFRRLERGFLGLPLVRSIYTAMRDLLGLFAQDENRPALQVVSVTLPGSGWKLLGFITRSEFGDLPRGVGGEGEVAVYLPMSYQVGGYTVMLPRTQVVPLEMSREDALRFILTGGLKSPA
jgi:uncharacterized membrane protein